MIQLPIKFKVSGKNKVALVPSEKPGVSESGLYLMYKDIFDFRRFIVLDVSDGIKDLKNGDEVLVDIKKTVAGTIRGWNDEMRTSYSIMIYCTDYDNIIAVFED